METNITFRDAVCCGTRGSSAAAVSCRMHFGDITLSMVPEVRRALAFSRAHTCDYSLGGIYMWVRWFGYRCAIVDNTLFISGMAEGAGRPTPAFAVPVGAMDRRTAIAAVVSYCRANNITPFFSAVPEESLDVVCGVLGGEARVEELTDWADYLYDAQDLATLHGKRYNKKRNHVNRFVADSPHWQMEELTPSLLPETELFLEGGLSRSASYDPLQRMADYEHHECLKVLGNWCRFPFVGAVLRGESGEIVAFSVAEVIGDTAYIHIEKARHDVPGAGEAVNHFFAAMLVSRHPGLRYLNREEDVGDESLRYAKNSYHPLCKLRKYNVYLPKKA